MFTPMSRNAFQTAGSYAGQFASRVQQGSFSNRFKWFFDPDKEFEQPVDFTPVMPCTFYRDSSNVVQHDMDFTQYTTGATAIYVDTVSGNDTTGDGTTGTPYKSFNKCLAILNASGDTKFVIRCKSERVDFYELPYSEFTLNGKSLAIVPDASEKRIMMTSYTTQSWALDDSDTYLITQSSVYGMLDLSNEDSNGLTIPLTSVADLATCKATPNSMYKNGSDIACHLHDGREPDGDVTLRSLAGFRPVLSNGAKLYCCNIDWRINVGSDAILISGDVSSEFCENNCTCVGGARDYLLETSNSNGISISNVGKVYSFECKTAYNRDDGFNYHYTGILEANRRDCVALEYNCESYNNGLFQITEINNGSTCHEGVNIIRFKTITDNCKGPVIADVNGCYTINIDCNSSNSAVDGDPVYYSNNYSNPSGITAKLIMVNCTHNGETMDSPDLYITPNLDATLYSSNLKNLAAESGMPDYEN